MLRCGYTLERTVHDYGVDLLLYTYDANGEYENDAISIQMKATDSLAVLQDQETISLSIACADLERWLEETLPIILILYDAQADVAYWMYVQAYFAGQSDFRLSDLGETTTVYLKRSNIVNEEVIRKLAEFKANVRRQIRGVIHHEG